MRLAIVGCGSIGSRLAVAVDAMDEVKRIYLADTRKDTADRVAVDLSKAVAVDSIEDELYHTDLVVEAASQATAEEVVPKAVSRGVDMMVMSVGSFADDDFREMAFRKAKEHDAKIFLPAGALCGVDGLRSASQAGLDSVELTTTMGPKPLADVRYLIDRDVDVDGIAEPTVVFSGSARDACRAFPKNINVAATVSLSGIGFDRTKVTIVCDPKAVSNSHELRYSGTFGNAVSRTYNLPEPDNPRTSALAVLSTTATLKRICRNEWFGI